MASAVTFAPTGGVSATDVQAALVELDAEKAALARATFSGPVSFSSVTTRWVGSGRHQSLAMVTDRPTRIEVEPEAEYALRTGRRGESGHRVQVLGHGDVHLNGGTLAVQEVSVDSDPTGSVAKNRAVLSVKANKLVVAFNDGSTTRYKWLPLSGSDASWVDSSSPP